MYTHRNLLKTIQNDSRSKNGYVTYIVLDQFGFFKVGRTKDFNNRIRQIRTANPHIVTYKIIEFDCENKIHQMLSYCKYKHEWFGFLTDYKEIKYPVFDFMDYTYFNILLIISLINKHGTEKAQKCFEEIMLNRFKHIYCCKY
jgi:hypothetical protein